ncbi:MAG: hypothetical protein PHV91_02650 [Bacteroidales bacterium]|jgi:hypothetical protein|nr:hypothetical protein [Bacteroidales bacterium]
MKQLITYLEDVLGQKIVIVPMIKEAQKRLPLFVTSLYEFYTSEILGRKVCLLAHTVEDGISAGQLIKHRDIVENIVKTPIIFVFSDVASYNRQRYIEKRINFIVPGKQLFMPELMMDIRNKKDSGVSTPTTELTPGAQFVLLWHLQKQSLNGLNIKQAAELLQMSYLNVNRAINTLNALNLCILQGKKEKLINFDEDKQSVWGMSVKYLINPVYKKVYTDQKLNYLLSGINALSHYTMINDENTEYYAISKEQFKQININTDKQYGNNVVEVWKYDPAPLSVNGFVDKLSLYALFKDEQDERIQIELDQLINQMKW